MRVIRPGVLCRNRPTHRRGLGTVRQDSDYTIIWVRAQIQLHVVRRKYGRTQARTGPPGYREDPGGPPPFLGPIALSHISATHKSFANIKNYEQKKKLLKNVVWVARYLSFPGKYN